MKVPNKFIVSLQKKIAKWKEKRRKAEAKQAFINEVFKNFVDNSNSTLKRYISNLTWYFSDLKEFKETLDKIRSKGYEVEWHYYNRNWYDIPPNKVGRDLIKWDETNLDDNIRTYEDGYITLSMKGETK